MTWLTHRCPTKGCRPSRTFFCARLCHELGGYARRTGVTFHSQYRWHVGRKRPRNFAGSGAFGLSSSAINPPGSEAILPGGRKSALPCSMTQELLFQGYASLADLPRFH